MFPPTERPSVSPSANGTGKSGPLDRLNLSDKAGVLLKIQEERVKDAGDSAPPDAAEHAAPALPVPTPWRTISKT
ncbi:MAG: hypothetical protein U1F77_12020 [Kiritimatiellia bacterium]